MFNPRIRNGNLPALHFQDYRPRHALDFQSDLGCYQGLPHGKTKTVCVLILGILTF